MAARFLSGPGDEDYRALMGTGVSAGLPALSRGQKSRRDTYTREVAEALAEEYSMGESTLKQIHQSNPHDVPPPMVVERWRVEKPVFDALMREAERARAMVLMEDTIPIAGNVNVNAAVTKNMIAARFRNAEVLDRARMGPSRTLLGDASQPFLVGAVPTRAELLAIARNAVPLAVGHEAGDAVMVDREAEAVPMAADDAPDLPLPAAPWPGPSPDDEE